MMSLFVRIFLTVAAVLLGLALLAFLFKLLVVAAVIAALVFGGIIVVLGADPPAPAARPQPRIRCAASKAGR